MNDLFDDDAKQGATLSPCRAYRYDLWLRLTRTHLSTASQCLFIMLNPSTADETTLDPTLRKCRTFAHAWGYDILRVVNLFAYRSTDPRVLAHTHEPRDVVGPDNNAAIVRAAREASVIVCAWGRHGKLRGRDDIVLSMLSQFTLMNLSSNGDGTPAHPLYLPGSYTPQIWRTLEEIEL